MRNDAGENKTKWHRTYEISRVGSILRDRQTEEYLVMDENRYGWEKGIDFLVNVTWDR